MLGWSEVKKWSYAVAEGEYERKEGASEIAEIDVHHHGWDGAELVPSWVVETELKNYLGDTQGNAPPRELFAKKKPKGHVAYIAPFSVECILLTGPVAELEGGYLTEVQHRTARYHVESPGFCFGSAKMETVNFLIIIQLNQTKSKLGPPASPAPSALRCDASAPNTSDSCSLCPVLATICFTSFHTIDLQV